MNPEMLCKLINRIKGTDVHSFRRPDASLDTGRSSAVWAMQQWPLVPPFPMARTSSPEPVLSMVHSFLQASNSFPDLGRGKRLPLSGVVTRDTTYTWSSVFFPSSSFPSFLFFFFLSLRGSVITEQRPKGLEVERLGFVSRFWYLYLCDLNESLNYSELQFYQL